MSENKIVEIIEFTDPVCTWCWGSEPLLKKLETRYGDQITIKYVMGGLVKDIRSFYDSYNDIGKDPERSNSQIAKHWLEASERHGMPVKTEGFRLFSNDFPSTYPQNIAYKAAQFEDQKLADKFLRRIREASASEDKQTNKPEVLIELASEVGLDIGKFTGHLNDGSAEEAFKEDLYTTSQFGVRGFPTFLIKYGDKQMMMRSYQNFESFESVIQSLTSAKVTDNAPEKSEENILEFIKKHGHVAPVEIQMSFDLSQKETNAMLDLLIEKSLVKKIKTGNGFFIEPILNPMSCDLNTGVCSL